MAAAASLELEYRDVFFIYNERETDVENLAEYLNSQGISSHLFRRDIPVGDEIRDKEDERLHAAAVVVVLLGSHGWGPTHLRMSEQASRMPKPLLPVMIGDPPLELLGEVGGSSRTGAISTFGKWTRSA